MRLKVICAWIVLKGWADEGIRKTLLPLNANYPPRCVFSLPCIRLRLVSLFRKADEASPAALHEMYSIHLVLIVRLLSYEFPANFVRHLRQPLNFLVRGSGLEMLHPFQDKQI